MAMLHLYFGFQMYLAYEQAALCQPVTLPVAKTKEQLFEEQRNRREVVVNVHWKPEGNTGSVSVDDEGAMDLDALTEYIREQKETAQVDGVPEFRVVIRGDKRAKYQYVRGVMAAIGKAEVPNVIFSAVDKELDR